MAMVNDQEVIRLQQDLLAAQRHTQDQQEQVKQVSVLYRMH